MSSEIADLADIFQPAHQIRVHNIPEFLRTQETDQLVIPGHGKGTVHGIHPLDSKLHRPATVQHTSRRINAVDLFRRYRDLPEGNKVRHGQEEIKVGHGPVITSVGSFGFPLLPLFLLSGSFRDRLLLPG